MKLRLSAALALALSVALGAHAVPACPVPVTVTQPDGRAVTVRLMGDEFHSWSQTTDGRTVVRDADGRYFYALIGADGQATPSAQLAHNPDARDAAEIDFLRANPSTTRPAISPEQNLRRSQQRQMSSSRGIYNYNKFRGLVILVNFSDVKFKYSNARSIFADIMSARNYTGYTAPGASAKEVYTGSVRDYFYDQSGGRFDPQFDVVGPVTISARSTDCKGSSALMSLYMNSIMRQVISAADAQVNFKNYDGDGNGVVDMFYVVFAGYASSFEGNNGNLLWPHASSLSVSVDGVTTGRYACSTEYYGWQSGTSYIDGIGTICHEFSHVLGLMDEYDTDYEGSDGKEAAHPGDWSLMASGTYQNKARTPVGYSMLQRMQAGFAYPRVINGNGVYMLEDIDASQSGYRINTPVAKEYFLLENRRKTGSKWNAYGPGQGLLVWRVDSTNTSVWSQNKINNNPNHMYYELVRARAQYSSAGPAVDGSWDPFPGSANVTSLTPTGTPRFLTWGGKRPNFSLDSIWEANDKIYVRVGPDASHRDVEDFETMTTSGSDDQGVQGRFTTWDFSGARVESAGGNRVLAMSGGSRATAAELGWRPVRRVRFQAVNTGSGPASVALQAMRKGKMTNMHPIGGGNYVSIPAGQSALCEYVVPMTGHTPLAISVTLGSVQIDDFTVFSEDINGVEGIFEPSSGAALQAWADASGIHVLAAPAAPVALYDLQGRTVARATADADGHALLIPHAPGCYIAASRGAAAKILFTY